MIVDDTNLTLKHVTELAEFAEHSRPGVQVRVKLFNTPLDVCLERNAKRTGNACVPEAVIRRFHTQLLESLSQESGEEFFNV